MSNLSQTDVISVDDSGGKFVLNKRLDKAFWSFEENEAEIARILDEEVEALINDIREREKTAQLAADGGEEDRNSPSLREVVADVLEVESFEVELALLENQSAYEKLGMYSSVTKRLDSEEDLEMGDGYGYMGWHFVAHKYQLNKTGERLVENEQLDQDWQ
ncbi:hypothetical protein [Haloferax volcanii]|uniref:hypothetical protein n=1 Tax=Haloferax volcanii TaxID=2246 RepID=UPI003D302568